MKCVSARVVSANGYISQNNNNSNHSNNHNSTKQPKAMHLNKMKNSCIVSKREKERERETFVGR